ncbi:MAG: hypothetical protein ACK56F_20020 [bacterium]
MAGPTRTRPPPLKSFVPRWPPVLHWPHVPRWRRFSVVFCAAQPADASFLPHHLTCRTREASDVPW